MFYTPPPPVIFSFGRCWPTVRQNMVYKKVTRVMNIDLKFCLLNKGSTSKPYTRHQN